jgi:hypothetical protein
LAPEYGVDPTIITHDVSGLVVEMVEGEWLEVVPQTHDAAEVGGEQ